MPLDCEYKDRGYGDYFEPGDDFEILATRRAKRCVSCDTKLVPGSTVLRFRRYRTTNTWVEVNIFGEDGEVPLAAAFHCEPCGGLFFALAEDRKYCVVPNEDMRELAREANAIDRAAQGAAKALRSALNGDA
jgi:hypothetical protein